MKIRKSAAVCLCLAILWNIASANTPENIGISVASQRVNGNAVRIMVKATIPPGVKLYGIRKDDQQLYSTLTFDSSSSYAPSGTIQQFGKLQNEKDSVMEADIEYFIDSVMWAQDFSVDGTDSTMLKGRLELLYHSNGEYIPLSRDIRIPVKPLESEPKQTKEGGASLWWIFFTAFGGGLIALLTPCVYSMVPVTVSFFTKRSRTRAEGIRNAITYSVSIITIFTVLGFLTTLVFGPAALNNLATNWIANLVFFALFLVFGLSFLGAFEITLPSSWTNSADRKAGTGSLTGIFFMALTLVLVSFSCTGPIIGNLLVLASEGNYWGPLTGMFGFSSALALPFALFAFFPAKLNVLGKAGGWLNAVKVTLGFLELALALKFLSNADLAKGWRLLDREIFLAAWIVIFVLLGIYLLGKIRFHHDDELPKNDFGYPYLSVTRLFCAIAAMIFSLYMLPGMWGAPLRGISAFLPPMGTQDFQSTPEKPGAIDNISKTVHKPERYAEQMHIYEPEVVTRYGLQTYFDYHEALEASRKMEKPLMLDFTGINCVNCRKMEGEVWSDPAVLKMLKENFVIASLYVDVHNIDIPLAEQYHSKALGKQIETLGDWNADLQVTRFDSNTQPYYFFLDGNEKRLVDEGYGYHSDPTRFREHLTNVYNEFKKSN